MGLVPDVPPKIIVAGTASRMRASNPVFGQGQWVEMALAANYLIGRGGQLVAGNPMFTWAPGNNEDEFGPLYGILAPGSSGTIEHYVWPRPSHTKRVWLISLFPEDPGGTATGTFSDESFDILGRFDTTRIGGDAYPRNVYRVVETVDSPSEGLATLNITVDSTSTSGVIETGVCCFDMPMGDTSFVLNEQTCNTKEPIYASTANDASIDGVTYAVDVAQTFARRSILFSWFGGFPVKITDVAYTGTSNVFRSDPIVTPRHVFDGTTTATVYWAALVRVTGEGSGQLKVTMTSGDSNTRTVSGSGWNVITGAVQVNTEDPERLAIDGGLRGGVREYAIVEMIKGTASSVQIMGFWMAENS